MDDESDFRRVIAKRLEKRGIPSSEASSGEECLSILVQKPMDVIVLDVKMPGMGGIETLDRIRKDYPKTEVILLTGQSSTLDGVEGIKAGAFDYLTKPVETEHLASKIIQAYEKVVRIEEKEAEDTFRKECEANMITTERLASLGTLAAGVAHEINNPLAVINESVGWLKSLLQRDEVAGLSIRKDLELHVEKIEKSVYRVKKITHQLLGIVRKSDFTISEIKLNELLKDTIELVQTEAQNKGVEVLLKTNTSNSSIWSDPYQLRQVIINLLNNAIHASKKGETITIALSQSSDGSEIEIQDQGAGIPDEHLAKIFEPFFSTKEPGEGTGLGLYVTRNIIEKLEGMIDVKSSLGKGTAFRIVLPKYIKEGFIKQ
ncbi:MAG: response regulator [Deltaproteobacteria bacterium]|nr:response regulator [Deltaproteobacteria bacterium]